MKSLVLRIVVSLHLVIGLTACGTLSGSSAGWPLSQPLSPEYLPSDAEITATLHLSRSEETEHYLMALSTRDDSLRIAVLTPQGMPLYRIEYSGSKPRVSRQLSMSGLLSPEELLGYLGLIYLEQDQVEAMLRKSWRCETAGQERRFVRYEGTPATVHISYRGEVPWYEEIRLTDTARHHTLKVQILGYGNAIPE